MATKTKKSQVASKTEMVDKTFYFMNVKYRGEAPLIAVGEKRQGELMFVDEDTMRFIAKKSATKKNALEAAATHETTERGHVEHPELHWRDVVGSLHGKVSVNANGVKVHMYIRHDDYKDSFDLADLIGKEMEHIGESLCDIDLKEEVSRCG